MHPPAPLPLHGPGYHPGRGIVPVDFHAAGASAPARLSAERRRYVLVDALRGLSALGVMTYHFGTGDLERPLSIALSSYATRLFEHGWIGVHVFFTLSGFVIAHSIGRREMTWTRALRFVFRRQVRLDPPYWFAIAAGTAIPLLWRMHLRGDHRFVPGPRLILAHVLYLYDLLGMRPINDVFWSLAIEVQFYLVFVLLLAFGRRVPRVLPWLLTASAIQSLRWTLAWAFPHAWCTQHWYLFALGALVAWALDGRTRAWLPALLSVACIAAGARFDRLEPVAGGLVALLLLVAGLRGSLGTWLSARPLQFLGAVSYGVYLLHNFVGSQTRWLLGGRFRPGTPGGATGILVSAVLASILVAWGLHRTIEGWSIRMAARIRWDRDTAPPPAPTEGPPER